MKPTAFALALLALTSGCPGTRPAAPVATEPLVAEQTIDVEGAREVLETFLDARWRFDRAATVAYVTAEDAENVWSGAFDDWLRLADMLLKDRDWRGWYAWTIESIEPIEEGRARATVEIVLPTAASLMASVGHSNFARVSAMTKIRDPMKMPMIMQKTQTIFVPTRLVFPMTYELVRDETGVWKVWMNWRALENFEDGDDEVSSFEGSEQRWFEAKKERSQGHDGDERRTVREIVRGAREAERLGRDRKHGEAVERYDKLLLDHDVPDFIADRPTELSARQKAWQGRLAEANVSIKPGKPAQIDPEHVQYPVTVENRGKREIDLLRVRLEPAGDDRSSYSVTVVFRGLEPGKSQTKKTKTYTKKGPQRIDRALVDSLRFDGEEKDPTRVADHEYRWKLQDYERGYRASYAATRVSTSVKALEEEIHDCPGWPEEPTDVRIDIAPEGQVTQVSGTAGDDAFEKCLAGVLGELQFPETEKRWGAVVQLFPAEYWEKLGVRDR